MTIILFLAAAVNATAELSSEPSATEFFDHIVKALGAGNYVLLGMLSVAVVVWAAEHFGPKIWPLLAKPIPGAVLALVMSILVATINAALGSDRLSLSLIIGSLGAGFTAWGGPAKLIALFTGSAPPATASK